MDDSAPIETNAAGGRQSKLYNMFILLAPQAMRCLTSILRKGGIKYEFENWRKIPVEEHVNHAMNHINNWLVFEVAKRTKKVAEKSAGLAEDELAHAFCRLMFAVELETLANGIHDEHLPAAHEQIERKYLRRTEGGQPAVSRAFEERERERLADPSSRKTGRPDTFRPSTILGNQSTGMGGSPSRDQE